MKTPFRMLLGAAALSAAVCVSSAAFAQAPPPGAMMDHADAQHDRWADHMREAAEAKAHALHDILNVRPDQDAAFQAMIGAMMGGEGHHAMGPDMGHDHDDLDQMTTPQRLDRMSAKMAERQAEFQRHADAVRAFYAVLSPDQKRAFDALTGLIMDDHHGMGDGPMMGGHGPHGGPED
jgi:periplasmic protein CpxP/Spy